MEDLSDHPSVKPRKLASDALLDTSTPGGVVLDPFLGSGTTLAAAHVSGRVGYGLELDPKYADVILRRLHKLTGSMPHLSDGTPLDVVARERGIEWEGGR
jgi:DNA modification methylase